MSNIDCSLPGVRLTSANNLVKKGNGTLRRIITSGGTTPTATIYDGVDATGALLVNAMPLTAGQSVQFDLAFQTGLFIVLGGTTPDVCAVYY